MNWRTAFWIFILMNLSVLLTGISFMVAMNCGGVDTSAELIPEVVGWTGIILMETLFAIVALITGALNEEE